MTTDQPATAPAGLLRPPDGPHQPPSPTRETPAHAPQEESEALRLVATRLKAAHPTEDPATVDALVAAAYAELRDAKVRTFIPILVERRARSMLTASHPDGLPQ